MDLTPLMHARLPIRVHAFAVLEAFVLRAVQLRRVKGTMQPCALSYLGGAHGDGGGELVLGA